MPGEQFNSFIEKKDVKGALEHLYNIYSQVEKARSEGKYNAEHEKLDQDAEAFLDKISGDEGFLLPFIDAVNEKYYQTAITLGQKRDEWEEKIKNGSIPETKLVKDEPETVHKIAHDIVLEKELDSNVVVEMQTRLAEKVRTKNEQFEVLFLESIKKVKNNVQLSSGLDEEKYNSYVKDMIDRNPSTTTGFKVIPGEYKQGDLIFEEIPQFASELILCNEPADVDDYEAEQYDIIFSYNNYIDRTKASVKAAKKLLEELDQIDNIEKSEIYQNVRKYLIEYTRLGTDYVYIDPDVPDDIYDPTDAISYIVADRAAKNLLSYVDGFCDEAEEKLNEIKTSHGVNSPEYKSANKLVDIAFRINNLTLKSSERNKEFKKSSITLEDVNKAKINIKYAHKHRDNKGFFNPTQFELSNNKSLFEKTMFSQIEKLNDSLIDSGVEKKEYYDLIKTYIERSRLMSNIEACDMLENDADYNRYKQQLKDNDQKLKNLINECREFEKTKEEKDLDISKKGIDRLALLDRMSKHISNEENIYFENKTGLLWGSQKYDRDILWLAQTRYMYCLMKEKGRFFDEEDRERYGFNVSGDVTDYELSQAEALVKNMVKDCAHKNSLSEIEELIENVSRNVVKTYVNMGKDYSSIYNSLEGQENRELKARYLFNHGGGRIEYGSAEVVKNTVIEYLNNYVDSKEFKETIDLTDKNLTFGQLFDALGFTEKESGCAIKSSKATIICKEDKIWDKFKANVREGDNRSPEEAQAWINATTISTIKDFICENLMATYKLRGEHKEIASLSVTEKKYYDMANKELDSNNLEDVDKPYKDIKGWVDETGKGISDELLKVLIAEKLQKTYAVLGNVKFLGVDPRSEVGRFYYNNLRHKDTYISDFLKEGKSSKEVIDMMLDDKKYEKMVKLSVKKLPVNYDIYIDLHSAGRAGQTPDEMLENLAKCMGAISMKENGEAFDVKKIHKAAKRFKELYSLDLLKKEPEKLREILRGDQTVRSAARNLRVTTYAARAEELDNYFDDMKKLMDNMWDPKNRSKEYKNLYNAVKDAAELKGNEMTNDQRAEAVINANIKIFNAVSKYTDGKEKIRRSPDGNARFNNAIDALAIISKYSPGMNYRINKHISNINKIRQVKPGNASYISIDTLSGEYGPARAKQAKEKAAPKAQPKAIVPGK